MCYNFMIAKSFPKLTSIFYIQEDMKNLILATVIPIATCAISSIDTKIFQKLSSKFCDKLDIKNLILSTEIPIGVCAITS